MTDLINRESRIIIDGIEIHSSVELRKGKAVRQGLDVEFKVERNRRAQPNKAEVRIFNLNFSSRGKIQRLKEDAVVIVEAGYKGKVSEIFQGTVRDARSIKERVDWISVIEASDGGRSQRTARVQKSFPPGTNLNTVLEFVASKMGLQIGNASKVLLGQAEFKLQAAGFGFEFVEGTVVSGAAADEFARLIASAGFEWSVQSGQIQLFAINGALSRSPVKLAAPSTFADGTGLIGSPEIGKKGLITGRALMNAQVVPGQLIELESQQVPRGLFVVRTATFTGAIQGQDWYVDFEAKAA